MSEELLSVSQVKRLELREGAQELKDFAVERVLNRKLLLLLTPKPGTQQDRSFALSEQLDLLLFVHGDKRFRFTERTPSSV